MKSERVLCQLCGEPMPQGEEMFLYHGYSGGCKKLPPSRSALPATRARKMAQTDITKLAEQAEAAKREYANAAVAAFKELAIAAADTIPPLKSDGTDYSRGWCNGYVDGAAGAVERIRALRGPRPAAVKEEDDDDYSA